MKRDRIKNNLLKLLGSVVVLSLSSCLKNGQYYDDFSAVNASVDLPLAASNSNAPIAFVYDASVTTASIPVYVNLASPSTLGKSVTATLALDTAYLRAYNTANSTNFQLIPDSVYSITGGWTRTIAAGKRLDSMVVTFNFQKMNLATPYVLPITIANSSEPIEQWNHLMLNPSVKNKYDGVYSLKGYVLRAGDAVLSGNFSGISMPLVTSGPASLTFGNPQPWANGTGVAIGNPVLAINTSGGTPNPVTITSSGGASNDPAYSSVYDPSTKTFYISFTWGAGPTSRLATDTLTYVKAR